MELTFTYQFGSPSIVYLTFLGITFVGFALGVGFWLDFRRRFVKRGAVAGLVVLIAGTLMGGAAGYFGTQPGHFRRLSAKGDGIVLTYYVPPSSVRLAWNEIGQAAIKENRLEFVDKAGNTYSSPVVYRGDQDELLQSMQRFIAKENL